MKDNLFIKDLYITRELSEKLINFLYEKTGLEWYVFRRKVDLFKALKEYVLSVIENFDDLEISFNDLKDYNNTVNECFWHSQSKERFVFVFTESEHDIIKDFCKKRNYAQETLTILIILYYLVNQNKQLKVKLSEFSDFFLCKGYSTVFWITNELTEKLKTCKAGGFEKNQRLFLKKALFYQMKWGKTPVLKSKKDEDWFRVSPQKTNWITSSFCAGSEAKEYISKTEYGSTLSIALLNSVNAYVDLSNKLLG